MTSDATRHTTTPGADPNEQARIRVESLIGRMAERDLPVVIGERMYPDSALRTLREEAEDQADEAGRGELVETARDRITRAYVLQFGDHGLRISYGASSGMATSRERADSQVVLGDLVLATAVEDLLSASMLEPLRADGERLLGIAAMDSDEPSGFDAAGDDPDALTVGRTVGPRLVTAASLVALVALTFLMVAGATEDLGLAAIVASVVAIVLLVSMVGPWERTTTAGPQHRAGAARRSVGQVLFWIVVVGATIVGAALVFGLVSAPWVEGWAGT